MVELREDCWSSVGILFPEEAELRHLSFCFSVQW